MKEGRRRPEGENEMDRWLPEVKNCTAMDIFKLSKEVNDEDFDAILGDEYFPHISNADFIDMRRDINCLTFDEGADEDEVDAASDLFEGAYAAFHQVPDISFIL